MSQTNKGTPSPSRAPGPSQHLALQGMKPIEQEAATSFQQFHTRMQSLQGPFALVSTPLVELLRNDPRVAQGVQEFSRLNSALVLEGRNLKPPIISRPQVQPFNAPAGAPVAPQFSWTWDATQGSNTSVFVEVEANAGDQRMRCLTEVESSGTAETRTALGIYFYPGDVSSSPNGILNISAVPAFSYSWFDGIAFSTAGTWGWIGLIVRSFDFNGADAGTLLDQRLFLWNDRKSFYGENSEEGSNTGFPLSAQVLVDSSHWYNIWVWCSTFSFAAGGTAGSFGVLNVTVPYVFRALFS